MVQEKYTEVMKNFGAALDFPWSDKSFYANWLAQTYYYTSKSTRLLLMAAAHMDICLPVLHRRFSSHASEETGHEILAKRDLEALGYSLEQIPEFSSTTSFYGTQFYKVQNMSAESLMGWVLPMEGLAIQYGAKFRDLVVAKDPKTKAKFLDVHVDEDPDHLDKAFKSISTLNDVQKKRVVDNMQFTVDSYLSMLRECQFNTSHLFGRRAS